MTARKTTILTNLAVLMFSSLIVTTPVFALSCDMLGSDATINNGETSTVNFSVNNSGGENAVAVRFPIADSDTGFIQFVGGSASGWTASVDGGVITFTGSTLPPAVPTPFSVQIKALSLPEDTLGIDGYVSSDGSNFDQCAGSQGISIITPTSTPTPTPTPTATTTTTTTTVTNTVTITVTPTPKPTPRPDKIAPVISLDSNFDKPFKEAPKITGKATDTDSGGVAGGVSSVDYSIDDGKNWLPVDEGTTKFGFTPAIFEDGDYKVKVRAKDKSGNSGYSGVKIMVIDRLPPQVGGVLFSIGPQVLMPTEGGVIYTLQGLDIKVTLSSVGGATEISLQSSAFSRQLVKNSDNGLWSGTLNFSQAGSYQLLAKSIDGAGNKTERALNNIVVLENGTIKGEGESGKGKGIKDAKVSLHYFEPSSGQFVLWDGASFGQANPQTSDQNGKYRLLIPPGRYYLQISANGYKTLKTNIFTTNQTLPLNTDFTLKPFAGFRIGPFKVGWPSQESAEIKLALPTLSQANGVDLTNKEMPFFSFKNDGSETSLNNLKGKPSVVTFLSIWAPQTFEQLPVLDGLSNNKEVNTLTVMSQDTVSRVSILKKIGGYKVSIVADPDGVLVVPLGIINLPTHIFLDRKGIIRKTKVGVLNKEELLDNLIN